MAAKIDKTIYISQFDFENGKGDSFTVSPKDVISGLESNGDEAGTKVYVYELKEVLEYKQSLVPVKTVTKKK
jgi:hypothetical protein